MRDISHGGGYSGGGASVDLNNLEALLSELTKAVYAVSLNVNVPPAAAPDVVVQVQPAALTAVPLPGIIVPAAEVKVQLPQQKLLAIGLFVFMTADIVIKILELLAP